MAQHARPNVHGQIADFLAQLTTFSTVVVRTGICARSSCCSRPIAIATDDRLRTTTKRRPPVENALAPDVDVPREEHGREEDDLYVPGPAQLTNRHRPRIQECDLDV